MDLQEAAKMTRSSWVFDRETKKLVPKDRFYSEHVGGGVVFLPDQPDFISPIDGKLYSGRAGMREHNARHDVVPNLELKGLPTLQMNSDQRSPEQRRASAEHRKQVIINEVNKYDR